MNNTEPYYLGGYFLMKVLLDSAGPRSNMAIYSCSECVNDSLLSDLSFSWMGCTIDELKVKWDIDNDTASAVWKWADNALENKKIGLAGSFMELEHAIEYKQLFFPHVQDVQTIGVYFTKPELERLLDKCKEHDPTIYPIGLYEKLINRVPEILPNTETFIGFDLIGIEIGGSFHSFHCHDIGNELVDKFDLTLNKYWLFEHSDRWEDVATYLNDEKNGCEPVPWFVCKYMLIE